MNLFAVDMSRCGRDLPEALRVVNGSPVDGLAISDRSVDVAECVEAVFTTLDSREVSGEELSILRAVK
jgi:hypothetical protein